MDKLKIIKSLVVLIVIAAIVIGSSFVFVNLKISNLEDNINKLPNDLRLQQNIVNDLSTVRYFYYVPLVKPKAFWAYNTYLSKFESIVYKEYKEIETKNTETIYSNATLKTSSINENQLRNTIKDSIINAGLSNLEQNPLGNSKETFCDKWSVTIHFLKESGYSYYTICQ